MHLQRRVGDAAVLGQEEPAAALEVAGVHTGTEVGVAGETEGSRGADGEEAELTVTKRQS